MTVCIKLSFIDDTIQPISQELGFLMVIPPVVSTRMRSVVLSLIHTSKLIASVRLLKSNKFLERLPYDVMTIGK
jgi:hypothetical protein